MSIPYPYLVVVVHTEFVDDVDRGEGEPLLERTLPEAVYPCKTTRDVAMVLDTVKRLNDGTYDWTVFETLPSNSPTGVATTVKRAVVLKRSGQAVVDCELS